MSVCAACERRRRRRKLRECYFVRSSWSFVKFKNSEMRSFKNFAPDTPLSALQKEIPIADAIFIEMSTELLFGVRKAAIITPLWRI